MKKLSFFGFFLLLIISFLAGCSTFVQDIKSISKTLSYTVSFDVNCDDESVVHGTMESQEIIKNKPEPLSHNKYTRDEYAFLGWSDEASATEAVYIDEQLFSAVKDITLYAVWGKPNYKIICHFKNLDGTDYEQDVFCYGEPGTKINVTAPEFEGFTPENPDPIEINIDQDPDTVQKIEIKYNRNKYTISFAADAYCNGTMDSFDAWYQETIPLPGCEFTNPDVTQIFAGWTIGAHGTQVFYLDRDEIEVSDNLSLYARWMDKGLTGYKVIHLFQNIDDDNYTENEDLSQELWGYDGTDTEAQPLSVTGFIAESFDQIKIIQNSDPEQEIRIKYKREKYTVTFEADEDCIIDPIEVPYQKKITFPKCNCNKHETMKFAGWSYVDVSTNEIAYIAGEEIEVTDTMHLYAQWEDRDTSEYKVIHLFQNINDDLYTEDTHLHQIIEGHVGLDTKAVPLTVPGFEAMSFDQKKIEDDTDGIKTIVEIYYNRKLVKLTFDLAGGTMTSPFIPEGKLELKYGAKVPVPVVEKEDHKFTGWTPALPSEAVADGHYTAGWEESYTYTPGKEGGLSGTSTKKQGTVAKTSIKGLHNTQELYIVPNGTVAIIDTDGSLIWDPDKLGGEEIHVHGAFLKDRKIELSPYIISQYPVTLELYESVMGPHKFDKTKNPMMPYKSDPVNNVSWYDAVIFCNKLSVIEGLEPVYYIEENGKKITDPQYWPIGDYPIIIGDHKKTGYRLPTNAEWEFAARGGDPSADDWHYAFSGANVPDGVKLTKDYEKDDNLSTVAYYKKNTEQKGPCTVGQKMPNRLGLYDMSGGICEWTYDYINSNCSIDDTPYLVDGVVVDPKGTETGKLHSLRGGSYFSSAFYCTVTYILSSDAKSLKFSYGFRLCRNAE